MKNIEVGYCVRRDGNVILQDVALVKITDRQIPEIAKYILSDVEYQTGELVCYGHENEMYNVGVSLKEVECL